MVNRKWAYRELFNSEEAAGGRPPCWQGFTSSFTSASVQNAQWTSGTLPATGSAEKVDNPDFTNAVTD